MQNASKRKLFTWRNFVPKKKNHESSTPFHSHSIQQKKYSPAPTELMTSKVTELKLRVC